MIGIKLQGRLGNQLFQYAFAYSAAKKLKTSFYIDQTYQKFILQQYFNLPPTPYLFLETNIDSLKAYAPKVFYYLKNKLQQFLKRYKLHQQLVFTADTKGSEVFTAIKDHTLFEGFFLSEIYFKDHASSLRKVLSVKSHLVKRYNAKYASHFNNKKLITVHIRKDDYLKLAQLNLGGDDLSLPLSYYHNMIAQLQSNNALFIFISDDIALINKEFSYLNNKFISDDNVINDFQHLLNADICVIANSTFSWWGAWLNNKPAKKIYAPKHFMGHLVNETWPADIYPPDWEIIDVHRSFTDL